ncbi:hypothetical protein LNN85_20415 [Klebsiella pneumoniae subsp. pneumoniae]|nr:hypothetical protein [Klebsiella pneumoniae subsp. pneumoniae]
MAVGARASDVLQQFLIEAVLVCLVGGALGVALSLMIAFILQLFLPRLGDWFFSAGAADGVSLFDADRGAVWLAACAQRGAARSGGCPGARIGGARNKNASQKDWHFISRMYTMKQKSYAAVSASTGTITLA